MNQECKICDNICRDEYDDFCGECMSAFAEYVHDPVQEKIYDAESVLGSYFENYAKDAEGMCEYCAGGEDGAPCHLCRETVDGILSDFMKYMNISLKVVEEMATQRYYW